MLIDGGAVRVNTRGRGNNRIFFWTRNNSIFKALVYVGKISIFMWFVDYLNTCMNLYYRTSLFICTNQYNLFTIWSIWILLLFIVCHIGGKFQMISDDYYCVINVLESDRSLNQHTYGSDLFNYIYIVMIKQKIYTI
jgi:hypothetical protein